jgi:DNA invertase Pin-like site-specific DNA recombinase
MKACLYARYSTDMQRKESIADQHRVCEKLAERHGFEVVARFSDAAISGRTTQRPDYQNMLRAARRRDFEIIVAEDSSRLWRNLAEQSPRLAELSDLGIHIVTHDLDTRSESAGIMGAVTGAMGEQYRKEIGRRVRRGLEGLAREGKAPAADHTATCPPRSLAPDRLRLIRSKRKSCAGSFNYLPMDIVPGQSPAN